MQCYVYKGNRRADTYLYITSAGDFSAVPEALLTLLGELEYILEIDLTRQKKLAQADIHAVIEQLHTKGYFVQLPPGTPGDDERLS